MTQPPRDRGLPRGDMTRDVTNTSYSKLPLALIRGFLKLDALQWPRIRRHPWTFYTDTLSQRRDRYLTSTSHHSLKPSSLNPESSSGYHLSQRLNTQSLSRLPLRAARPRYAPLDSDTVVLQRIRDGVAPAKRKLKEVLKRL